MSLQLPQKRLAIIGAGCSGLITLKTALQQLPDWEIICYEKSENITGVWGRPYKRFISTSTKYTTQFACHMKYDANVHGQAGSYRDFFQESEYGDYLEDFVSSYNLSLHIRKNHLVRRISRIDSVWQLTLEAEQSFDEFFTTVIVCTGLASHAKTFHKEKQCEQNGISMLRSGELAKGKRIVVLGGGESAVDVANQLADPELNNDIYLSLRGGIRVSPRYHPIRGVPSDFLRTRLMLSIHENIRNNIGHRFVKARIKYAKWFRKLFPGKNTNTVDSSLAVKRAYWDLKLTERAKGPLFNVFHNKSEEFLDAVAEDRIKIIGSAVDDTNTIFFDYDNSQKLAINPELLVPAIGYFSGLSGLFSDSEKSESIELKDFYLACVHVKYSNLFLIGYARPIIGNIPSISEMQAEYVVGLISGKYSRPEKIEEKQAAARRKLETCYPTIDTNAVYPVDMFPYCDQLAKDMGSYPYLHKLRSLWLWLKIYLLPASTTHYLNENFRAEHILKQKIYIPAVLVFIMLLIKLIDWPYSLFKKVTTN